MCSSVQDVPLAYAEWMWVYVVHAVSKYCLYLLNELWVGTALVNPYATRRIQFFQYRHFLVVENYSGRLVTVLVVWSPETTPNFFWSSSCVSKLIIVRAISWSSFVTTCLLLSVIIVWLRNVSIRDWEGSRCCCNSLFWRWNMPNETCWIMSRLFACCSLWWPCTRTGLSDNRILYRKVTRADLCCGLGWFRCRYSFVEFSSSGKLKSSSWKCET